MATVGCRWWGQEWPLGISSGSIEGMGALYPTSGKSLRIESRYEATRINPVLDSTFIGVIRSAHLPLRALDGRRLRKIPIMSRHSVLGGQFAQHVLLPLALLVGACDSGNSATSAKPGTGPSSSTIPPGSGLCADTCSKDCSSDTDCDMSAGLMCCDLGLAGKTCLLATECPRFCSDDSRCDTSRGQACLPVSLSTEERICTTRSSALVTCTSDANCDTGDVCCQIYNQAICLPSNYCPKVCSASSECDPNAGEICCTTARMMEPNLVVDGLCLNPNYESCPQPCSQSIDCSDRGSVCCDGLCQRSCPKTCQQSSDCNNQVCCKSALVRLPSATAVFRKGPRCVGDPIYDCSSSGCSSVIGCTPSDNGSCEIYDTQSCLLQSSRSECNALSGCSYSDGESCVDLVSLTCEGAGSSTCAKLPGCTWAGSVGSCLGYDLFTCSEMYTAASCADLPGCTWNGSTSSCSGTPRRCSSFTSSTTCESSPDCYWSTTTSGECAGTPTPCPSFKSPASCDTSYNCRWTSFGGCSGTPLACSSFATPATCATSSNCSWGSPDGCSGTATPCSQLSLSQCTQQQGCSLADDT